MFLFKSMDQK